MDTKANPQSAVAAFYQSVPVLSDFAQVADTGAYVPVPGTWVLGVSDVVGSTKAIEQGRYKAVNMVGASIISAAMNAFGHRDFPFVFGGDGAALAISPEHEPELREAMARTRIWAEEETGLKIRAAIIPVSEIRNAGHDLKVAKYQAAPSVTYAMFSGGGITWADGEMKADRFAVHPAPAGAQPDLTGLSCRWTPITSANGVILSILALPAGEGSPFRFDRLVQDVLDLLQGLDREGHPVPVNAHDLIWPPEGIDLEVAATRGRKSRVRRKIELLGHSLFQWVLDRTERSVGRYDPMEYRREISRNSDFRKFDDGLRLTVDCTEELARRVEARLSVARTTGVAVYGVYRQDTALMTCLVPSAVSDDHMHFIDGGGGGYAQAARMLKAQIAGAE
ncbi:MAG: DUF3095 domain-containing protein [Pseudomonadota bacterium]